MVRMCAAKPSSFAGSQSRLMTKASGQSSVAGLRGGITHGLCELPPTLRASGNDFMAAVSRGSRSHALRPPPARTVRQSRARAGLGPRSGTTADGGRCPWDAAATDYTAIKRELTHNVARRGAKPVWSSSVEVLEYVCVDQETIISHDPRRFREVGRGVMAEPHDLPAIDYADMTYWFRPGSQRAAHEALGEDSPYSRGGPREPLSELVIGRKLNGWPGPELRLASPREALEEVVAGVTVLEPQPHSSSTEPRSCNLTLHSSILGARCSRRPTFLTARCRS